MSDGLAIWLYGQDVAHVARTRNRRLRLTYSAFALQKYELGTPLLSLALPVSSRPFPNEVVTSFLDGLLPEGDALRAIAEDLDLRATDTYNLIGALGRDCAGALIIQPESDPPPAILTVYAAEPLRDAEVADLIDNLRAAPLGISRRVRISLGGVQEKLLLTQISPSTWGRPVDGTPSTHILKPQIRGFSQSVENEAFCMRVAAYAGLRVASVRTIEIGERQLLVAERYDRSVQDDGTIERIHQEDFCQAFGISPRRKYEEDGGPSLRRIAGTLQSVPSDDDVEEFLRAVTLNVVLGNGDAHGKNFSLLHERSGALRLAPLYDLLCTLVYGQNRLALHIDHVQRLERVTAERVVNEATSWGLSRRHAHDVVGDALERMPAAIERAFDETTGLPDDVLRTVTQQFDRMRSS